MKLGVFDSGVGGLTVARSLQRSGYFSELLYYGDTARVPYGSKDANTVMRYALEAVEFFNGANVDALVVACNTVSVVALEIMQQYSNKPVYGVLEPGVLALTHLPQLDKQAKILVIATRATIASGEYQRRIQELGFNQVEALATPLFVPMVEEELFDGPIIQETFKHYFNQVSKPDVVLLGCTHFPLLAEPITAYFNGAQTIHSGEAMVHWLQQQLQLSVQFKHTPIQIMASENVEAVARVAKRWQLT
ncbi:glutamate racemase [Idiomarina seosinensis]|uniref:glutamate racemase n=1 Tax=Idiomarina seosinensis TaxID=281739 RepID=UPI00384FB655